MITPEEIKNAADVYCAQQLERYNGKQLRAAFEAGAHWYIKQRHKAIYDDLLYAVQGKARPYDVDKSF